MWGAVLFAALVLGILQVKGDADCAKDRTQCQRLLPVRKGFPGSVEDFDRSCPFMLAYLECVKEYINKCGSDVVPDPESVPELLVYLRDACDKDSDTHESIKKHLPCLQTNFNNQDKTCKDMSNKALNYYMETNQISDEDNIFGMHAFCYRVTSSLACYIARIQGNCETGAKDLLFDVLRRTKYLSTVCYEENVKKYLEFLKVLELNRSMKEGIKELFGV